MIHLIPLILCVLFSLVLARLNARRGWFRLGELIFWDLIVLVVVFLIWLRWF